MSQWDPVEQGREIQDTPAELNRDKWPGGMKRERDMKGDELNRYHHNLHGKSQAGQRSKKYQLENDMETKKSGERRGY